MPLKDIETIALPSPSPGTQRTLRVIRYGDTDSVKKAYLQAGLHADEPPGQLAIHHLQILLDKAAEENRIPAQIILVPTANPIGLAQWSPYGLRGRFDLATGTNFNRNHLDLIDAVAEAVEGSLGQDPETNAALIRQAMGRAIQEVQPDDEASFLKKTLLTLSHDAQVVLDLHCDYESLLHVYTGTPLWPDATDLSAQMGAAVTLLARESGSDPFDEACSKIWWSLADKFPDHPIPMGCLAATVEFRGMADVNHDLARQDARNLYHFLARRGFIDDQVPDLPPLQREATPLRGMEEVKAVSPGVVVFLKKPGDKLAPGEVVAQVIDPTRGTPEERVVEVKSEFGGLLMARQFFRQARPGTVLARIAGDKPIKGKGKELLSP